MEREGVDVIHLEIGEPDFAAAARRRGGLRRGAARGARPATPTAAASLDLREAIAAEHAPALRTWTSIPSA